MRKKISQKIRTHIENAVKSEHRCIFLIFGDRAKDQIINLYQLWKNVKNPNGKPNLLWCFNKELGFSSHQKKRKKEINKMIKQGLYEKQDSNPFENFISSLNIRYCYYKETSNILGSTYDLLILQDFEALTPNILCQTIETVQSGGIVFFMLNSMKTLKNLYTMKMNIHQRFRTDAFSNVQPLFNERMIISLAMQQGVLFVDDELNLLPVSETQQQIEQQEEFQEKLQESHKKQLQLVESLKSNKNIYELLKFCKTFDQTKIVLKLLDSIRNSTFQNEKADVKFITASRGRGKSSALGLSIAGALIFDCSNVYVSAATPENLVTVFEFIEKGLEQMGMKKNLDFQMKIDENKIPYEIQFFTKIQNEEIVKIRTQKVSYLKPGTIPNNPDLLVIDEAAAIPLNILKPMIYSTQCNILISSTIHGYEGTGRSLSLKLIENLRKGKNERESLSSQMKVLEEMQMEIPIRYNICDPIENWLNNLLCLDCGDNDSLQYSIPYPDDCKLYLVNKETLFSYNKSSEVFLKKIWSLFVSSHYKNSPNDLQLFSDAPAHCLAVLLGPLKNNKGLPDVLVAIQFCFEGKVNSQTVSENQQRGFKPSGDLIPWTFSEQFLNSEIFSQLGIRIVRIATHKKAQGSGLGTKALKELEQFFQNQYISDNRISFEEFTNVRQYEDDSDNIQPRKSLQPLLKKLTDVAPIKINYLSVAFGINKPLFRFWNKNGFKCFYLKQKSNEVTGENTCMMIKSLPDCELNMTFFFEDFSRRFVSLLYSDFSNIDLTVALDLVDANLSSKSQILGSFEKQDLSKYFSLYDMQRLEAYSENKIDHYIIKDLVPLIAGLFFKKNFPVEAKLSFSQALILMGFALQNRTIQELTQILKIDHGQILALYNKAIKRLTNYIKKDMKKNVEEKLGFAKNISENIPLNTDAEQMVGDLKRSKKISKKQINQFFNNGLQQNFSFF